MSIRSLFKNYVGVHETMMNSAPPKTLGEVAQQNNQNKHAVYFYQAYSGGEGTYFFPISLQKNGGLNGAMYDFLGGSMAGKAKSGKVSKMDFSRWKMVPRNEIPEKILGKLEDKKQEMFKKL